MTAAWIPPRWAAGIDDAALWNAVIGCAGQPIPLRSTGATLTFAPAEPPPGDAWLQFVALPPHPEPIFLRLTNFPFRGLFGADLDVADLAALPDGLRQALTDGILATLRAMLPQDHAAAFELRGQGLATGFADLARPGVEWFSVRLEQGEGAYVELLAGCDRAFLLRALPPALALSDGGALEPLAARISIPADLTLGSITLALRELPALEPGAIVVLAEQSPGTLQIRLGPDLFEFTDTGSGWRSSGPAPADRLRPRPRLHKENGTPMDDENPAVPAGEPVALGDLRVAIDFDLGRSMVPLSVLAQWQAGAIVELSPPPVGEGVPVTIRANGDVVGTGDIVRIDNRIAVRITRFSLRP